MDNKNIGGAAGSVEKASSADAMGGALEPLGVSPKQACRILNVGMTRLYQLINAAELDAYYEGTFRRVTLASIRHRHERQLAEVKAGGLRAPGRRFWVKGAKAAPKAGEAR